MSSWRLWTRMLLVRHLKGWVHSYLLARVLWAAMPWIYRKKLQRTSRILNVVSMSVLQKQAKPQLIFVNFPCKRVLGISGDFWDTVPDNQTSECFKKYRSSLDASLFDPSRPLQENGDSVVPAEHLEDAKRQSEEPLPVVSNTVLALFWEFYTWIDMELLGRLVRKVLEVSEVTKIEQFSGERLPYFYFWHYGLMFFFWRRLLQSAVA